VVLKNVEAQCCLLIRSKFFFNMLFITIQELEAAINYWRNQSPAVGEELYLCPEVAALAKPYALMIVQAAQRVPMDVLDGVATLAIQKFLNNNHAN
jgi:Protein of unknown function (DUF3717)